MIAGIVEFVPYEEFLSRTNNLSPAKLQVKSFGEPATSVETERLAGRAWSMFLMLPAAEQQKFIDKAIKCTRIIPATRAGDVLGTVVQFLPAAASGPLSKSATR